MQTQPNFLILRDKRFHYIWLRDNCLCPQCHRPSTLQKTCDISQHTSPPEPISVEEKDGKLIINWNEVPPHQSIFPISWLMTYAYDLVLDFGKDNDEIVLWDSAWLEDNPVEKYDPNSCEPELWMNQLFRLGFVVLENIAQEKLEPFLSSLGPLMNVEHGGKFYSVKATTTTEGRIYLTGDALEPHNAFCSWDYIRFAKFLYCVTNNASGGDSLLVDSFRVAEDFRQDYPNYFKILTELHAPFWRVERNLNYMYSPNSPIIKLTQKGELAEVRFKHDLMSVPDFPFEQMESFYEAYFCFHNYTKDVKYQYRFRLKPGDCQVIQNFRVFHGRTAFDPSSGERELKSAYLNWDYLVARRNFERQANIKLK
ncbi:MAG: TauD/TfdA family dioxygenase [Cyanobacteria bacterium P01_A01_bin.83]